MEKQYNFDKTYTYMFDIVEEFKHMYILIHNSASRLTQWLSGNASDYINYVAESILIAVLLDLEDLSFFRKHGLVANLLSRFVQYTPKSVA